MPQHTILFHGEMTFRSAKRESTGGFTLIEVMIVVTIIALLAAIAIPAYRGHILSTKIAALQEHFHNAIRVVKSEAAKIAAGNTGEDVIGQLNSGARSAIGNGGLPAFVSGSTAAPGQIAIDGLDTNNRPQFGVPSIILATPVTGTQTADYTFPLTSTFTPE